MIGVHRLVAMAFELMGREEGERERRGREKDRERERERERE